MALIHSLAVFIDQEIDSGRKFSPPLEWILRENKWRAARPGVSCDLIGDLEGNSVPFKHLWLELVRSLTAVRDEFNYGSLFNFLDLVIANGPSYKRQRAHFDNNFNNIVRHLIRENKTDTLEWSI